jgi:hypothetical protein
MNWFALLMAEKFKRLENRTTHAEKNYAKVIVCIIIQIKNRTLF